MDQLFNRKYIIQGIFVLLALILIGKLFYMQIVTDKYFLSANNTSLRKLYEYPARGVIFDRNNKILVQNQPTYDLVVTPNDVVAFDTLALCDIIGIDTVEFNKKYKKAIKQSRFQEYVFQKLISIETYAKLQERMYNFKGFSIRKRTIRYYPDSTASHFLGYMQEVTPKDIERHQGYYKPADYIGKTGIEKSYETYLRGKKGVTYMLYNAKNVAQGSYQNGKSDSIAVAGDQLTATIDIEIQKLGEQLLANKVGSVVALEPSTGEVLAFVSSPGYEPNQLVGNKFSTNFKDITANPNRAFMIRPIQGQYSPGSAFKPLDALIALNEGIVDPNTTFFCPGYYVAGNRRFKCDHTSGDGPVALRKGIAKSCNVYFYEIFARLMTKNGRSYINQQKAYDKWQNMVRKFGIGDTLGIDLPSEKAKKLFRPEDYTRQFGKYWGNTTIMSVSIGQGEINTTPLQMANIMAIIANKGYYVKPHVIKAMGNGNQIDPKYKVKNYVGIDSKYFDPVIDGMQDAVNSPIGTARESQLPNGLIMCGKTGTVQNTHGKNHSVFIGFAPRDNPKIAIAVIIENGGYGGAYAAPIASFITEKYLTRTLSNRRINGSTAQQFMDDNLLPIAIDKKYKAAKKPDSVIADSTKNKLPAKLASIVNNKEAILPKKNATTK